MLAHQLCALPAEYACWTMPQLLTLSSHAHESNSFNFRGCFQTPIREVEEAQEPAYLYSAASRGMQRYGSLYGLGSSGDLSHEVRHSDGNSVVHVIDNNSTSNQSSLVQQQSSFCHEMVDGGDVDPEINATDPESGIRSSGGSSDGQSSSGAKSGDYSVVLHELLNGRYHVVEFLGRGTFGQVVKCLDNTTHDYVAVKILKNHPSYARQGQVEVSILRLLNSFCADDFNFVLSSEWFAHHGHSCVVFEILQLNLYDFLKQHNFQPMRLHAIRPILQQVTQALCKLKELGIIHADLKPENIMLVDQKLMPYRVKVIDFGSALHTSKAVSSTYLQSRYYRAPEIILSLPFNEAIDVWSLGCVVAELFLGWPLFPGASEYMQMKYIVESAGMVPQFMIDQSSKKRKFFRQNYASWSLSPTHGKGEEPKEARKYILHSLGELANIGPPPGLSAVEQYVEKVDKVEFVNLLRHMLMIDPAARAEPLAILKQSFVTGSHLDTPFHNPIYHSALQYALEPMAVCEKNTATHCYCPVHIKARTPAAAIPTILSPLPSPQLAMAPASLDPLTQAHNLVYQRCVGPTQVFLNTPTHTVRDHVHAPLMPIRVTFPIEPQPQILLPALPRYADGNMSSVGSEAVPALITYPQGMSAISSEGIVSTSADVSSVSWSTRQRAWSSAIPAPMDISRPFYSTAAPGPDSALVNSLPGLIHGVHLSSSTLSDSQPVYQIGQNAVYGSSEHGVVSTLQSQSPDGSRNDSPHNVLAAYSNSKAGSSGHYSGQPVTSVHGLPDLHTLDSSRVGEASIMASSSFVQSQQLSQSWVGGPIAKPRIPRRSRFLSLGHTPPSVLRSQHVLHPSSTDHVDSFEAASVYPSRLHAGSSVLQSRAMDMQQVSVNGLPPPYQVEPSSAGFATHHQRAQSFAGSSYSSMSNLQQPVPSPDSHGPPTFVTPMVAAVGAGLAGAPLSAPPVPGQQQMFVFPSNSVGAVPLQADVLAGGGGAGAAMAVSASGLSHSVPVYGGTTPGGSLPQSRPMVMLDGYRLART